MLEWKLGHEQRTSELRSLDPFLEEYESDYHYIFARIYREAQTTSGTSLGENYVIPNMARRLLEMFLAFHRPQRAGDLWQKMQTVDYDEATKTRILRFVHTYSHSDFIGGSEYDTSSLAETPFVLQDILKFIQSQAKEHYEAMEGLVKKSMNEKMYDEGESLP